ncbi:MAG: hypothetical protein HUU50_16800 [Candidatus Brocadiae bacterium]|nr:hypothetical protein [Candidatus Brocadiia bacterium]
MTSELPIGPSIMLLLPLLPGIYFLANILMQKACGACEDIALFSPGVSLTLWLFFTHAFSLLLKNFALGLVASTVFLSFVGYFIFLQKKSSLKIFSSLPRAFMCAWILCVLFLVPSIFFWDFHDKMGSYSSHFSTTSQILNNIYPPRDFCFPDKLLNYHYGINTLFAMVTVLTRIPLDISIDIVTLFLWGYFLLLLASFGKKMFGEKAAIPCMILSAFVSGFPWVAGKNTSITYMLLGFYQIGNTDINPPLCSYFFQHPWTIGSPLAILIFLLLKIYEEKQIKNSFFCILLCLFCSTLSFSNMTLFLSLTATVGIYYFYKLFLDKKDYSHKFFIFLTLVIVIGFAYFLSGFSNSIFHAQEMENFKIGFALGGIAGDFESNILWNLASFGFVLPLGIIGLFFLPSMKEIFLILALGGIFISNNLRYASSWDIVKFATLAQLALSFPMAALLIRICKIPLGKLLSLCLGFFAIAWGISFHTVFFLSLPNNVYAESFRNSSIAKSVTQEEVAAISWLRKNISAGEIVLSEYKNSLAYIYLGGFPQLWIDSITQAYGFSQKLLERRHFFMKNFVSDYDLYKKENVRWVIADRNNSGKISSLVEMWKEKKYIEQKASFGTIGVYCFVQ